MYGIHFDDPLSVDNVLQAEGGGGRRPATAVGGSAKKQQNLVVKAQLHNQMTKLRGAFLHQDPRIEGTIPSYMVPYTLKAGGLDLDKGQCTDAKFKFMTGEGRFNWLNFCDHIEKARAKQWSEAARLKSAKMFADIDRDGSGRLDPGEIKEALKRLKVNITDQKVMELVRACDSDGDGNISFPEFVDGLSKDLVAPDSVWSERAAPTAPHAQSAPEYKVLHLVLSDFILTSLPLSLLLAGSVSSTKKGGLSGPMNSPRTPRR